MKYENYLCHAAIGSVTEAMKAERILSRAAIHSEVVKVDKSNRFGCIYGISFPCVQKGNVLRVLSSAGIRIKE